MKLKLIATPVFIILAGCSAAVSTHSTPNVYVPIDGIFDDIPLAINTSDMQLPVPVQNTLRAFIAENELNNPTPRIEFPGGFASYEGAFAAEIASQDGNTQSILDGEVRFSVDFPNDAITGRLFGISAYDAGNNRIATTRSLTWTGEISAHSYVATIADDFDLDGQTVQVNGQIEGTFTGRDAQNTLGLISGEVTGADGSVNVLTGVIIADEGDNFDD